MLRLIAAALLVVGSGCVCSVPVPVVPGDCVADMDCPSAEFYFCETITSRCEPSCRADVDCNDRPEAFIIPACEQPQGCHCDHGRCAVALCSADVECGTQACRNGVCVDAPSSGEVARCALTPDFKVLRQGERARFHVAAWNTNDEPVVIPAGPSWTGLDTTPLGNDVELIAPKQENPTPSVIIRASFGAVSCEARAIVLPREVAGQVAISIVDERTGRPLAGAKLVLSAADGTIIQQGGADFLESDAAGFVRLTHSGAAFSVSAFHLDYAYLTVANLDPMTSRLAIAVRRNPIDTYGGFAGTFDDVPINSNLHFGRTGFSMGGELAHEDLSEPPGPIVPIDLLVGTIQRRALPVPAGSFIRLGDQAIKAQVAAHGRNGTCGDEQLSSAGACGEGSVWAITANLTVGDLNSTWEEIVDSDQFSLLRRIGNYRKFSSSLVRDVRFGLRPTPLAPGGTPDFSDQSHFTPLTQQFAQLPLAFEFVTKLPGVPRYRGSFVERAFLVGGALVPGRGFVPLGLGTGENSQIIDSQVEGRDDLFSGQVAVRMAPTHHGLEGAPYLLVSQLSSTSALTDARAGKALSALITRFPDNRLQFDSTGTRALVDLSVQAFLPMPEGGQFDFVTRRFTLPAQPAEVSVLRVSFTDPLTTQWEVLVDPRSPAFTLPTVPGTLRDRVLANGSRARMSVQSLRVSSSTGFSAYLGTYGTSSDISASLNAFSFVDVRPATITFKWPDLATTTLTRGTRLVLFVEGFAVGQGSGHDGVVALTFPGASGCPAALLRTEARNAGSGILEYDLPQTCTGTNITILAELVGTDGATALVPPIARTITVSIP